MMPSSPIWRDPAPVLSVDAPGTGQSWYLGFTVPWNPRKPLESGFGSFQEARTCYGKFHIGVFVSQEVRTAFCQWIPMRDTEVLYNTVDSDEILKDAAEPVEE